MVLFLTWATHLLVRGVRWELGAWQLPHWSTTLQLETEVCGDHFETLGNLILEFSWIGKRTLLMNYDENRLVAKILMQQMTLSAECHYPTWLSFFFQYRVLTSQTSKRFYSKKEVNLYLMRLPSVWMLPACAASCWCLPAFISDLAYKATTPCVKDYLCLAA